MTYRLSQPNGKIIRYNSKPRNLNQIKPTEEASLDDIYSRLKRDVKRSSIITRMHQKKNAGVVTRHTLETKRPQNEVLTKA